MQKNSECLQNDAASCSNLLKTSSKFTKYYACHKKLQKWLPKPPHLEPSLEAFSHRVQNTPATHADGKVAKVLQKNAPWKFHATKIVHSSKARHCAQVETHLRSRGLHEHVLPRLPSKTANVSRNFCAVKVTKFVGPARDHLESTPRGKTPGANRKKHVGLISDLCESTLFKFLCHYTGWFLLLPAMDSYHPQRIR